MKLINRKASAAAINKAVLDYFNIEGIGNSGNLDVPNLKYIRQAIIRKIYEKHPKAPLDKVEQFTFHIMKDVMVISRIIVATLSKSDINSGIESLINNCNEIQHEIKRVCMEHGFPLTGLNERIVAFTIQQMERVLFGNAPEQRKNAYKVPEKEFGKLLVKCIHPKEWLQFATECETKDDYYTISYLLDILPLAGEERDFVEAKVMQMKLRGIG